MPGESDEHRLKITPEQRRVLGRARSKQDWAHHENGPSERVGARSTTAETTASPTAPPAPPAMDAPRPVRRPSPLAHVLEAQNIALIFGGFILLFAVFYAGKKFDQWRYQLMSQARAKNVPSQLAKYAASSPNELVDQAIVDQRIGNWKEAIERLLAAKAKNLLQPGLLFRAAKIYYDQNNFDAADALFDRAIAFHEDIAEASYYRGMVAKGRGDLAAAERFFEAAASAAPFNADYFYTWAETLRRERRSKEASTRYQEAALRAPQNQDVICRLKARLAAIEAGDIAPVSDELEKKLAAGQLTVDWLMTQSALDIQQGKIEDAARLIAQARSADASFMHGFFVACASDKFFTDAATNYPQLADVLRGEAATR